MKNNSFSFYLWTITIVVCSFSITYGQIVSWSTTTALPANNQEAGAVVWNNWVYVTGGDADGQGYGTNTVYRAQINANGTLSSWSSSTMPVYKEAHGCVTHAGRLYVIGGNNDWGSTTSS